MNPRIITSLAAVVGGVGWVTKGVLVGVGAGSGAGSGIEEMARLAQLGGLVLLVSSLAAAGYLLVQTAPVWLRAVVTVAVPLLVLAVWEVVRSGLQAVYPSEGWLRDELPALVGGSLAILLGLWGLRRRRPEHAVEPDEGRRATRRSG
jgi:hypothetical protein